MDEDIIDIRPGTPMNAANASKNALVLLHKEMVRQKELMDRVMRNAKILAGVRQAMEAVLDLDHTWDLSTDYDPDDPPEKREEDNPLKRMLGL